MIMLLFFQQELKEITAYILDQNPFVDKHHPSKKRFIQKPTNTVWAASSAASGCS